MTSLTPFRRVGIVVGLGLVLFLVYRHLQYFGDVSFLGAILLLEVILACVWRYEQRYLILLIVTFTWAGMNVPLQGAWTAGRWVVLAVGAGAGFIAWTKNLRRPFGSLHLIAFFCVCAAFVSATISSFVQMASFKAFSLMLLLLYCSTGARLAVFGREDRFFNALLGN